MKKAAVLAIWLLLAGCSGKNVEDAPDLEYRLDCTPLVVLPDNFIIDLAAGSEVQLNPARQPFALFCTPAEAREALEADQAAGRIDDAGKWRIYRLQGNFRDLAKQCGAGQFCLATPASLADWLE